MAGDDEPVDRPEELPAAPNAADPTDLEKRRRRRRGEVRDVAEFWKLAFASPIGRRALWEMLHKAGTFGVQFAAGPNGTPDPLATWYHAGRRDLGLAYYHEWMVLNREGVLKMLEEHDPRFQPISLEPATAVQTDEGES